MVGIVTAAKHESISRHERLVCSSRETCLRVTFSLITFHSSIQIHSTYNTCIHITFLIIWTTSSHQSLVQQHQSRPLSQNNIPAAFHEITDRTYLTLFFDSIFLWSFTSHFTITVKLFRVTTTKQSNTSHITLRITHHVHVNHTNCITQITITHQSIASHRLREVVQDYQDYISQSRQSHQSHHADKYYHIKSIKQIMMVCLRFSNCVLYLVVNNWVHCDNTYT